MPTFHYRLRDNTRSDKPIKYHALIYTRGSAAHRLALHREISSAPERSRQWVISDPASGCLVCRVKATYKGMPVTSSHLTLAQARSFALVDLDSLVDRIGLAEFERVMADPESRIQEMKATRVREAIAS
jgi:hypothetical protein